MNIVKRYTSAMASTLTPLLSRLSAGTEMASYCDAQWNFLLGSDEVTAFVVIDASSEKEGELKGPAGSLAEPSVDETNRETKLLGCVFRIDSFGAPRLSVLSDRCITDSVGNSTGTASAGFGMMLVSPEARGQGLAKLLLNEAIFGEDDRIRRLHPDDSPTSTKGENLHPRKVLAVCTNLGQPLYRKLGFSDVGRVTALRTTVQIAGQISKLPEEDGEKGCSFRVSTYGLWTDNSEQSSAIDPEIQSLIVGMDAQATGLDRSRRLKGLMDNNRGSNLRSFAAVAFQDNEGIASAIIRQEAPEGPFVIGPLLGPEDAALPLVRALARAVVEDGNEEGAISILVPDHPDLVDRLTEVGFQKTFDFPAMTMDGKPVYPNGDGSYLSLIHPTLG